MNKLSLDYFRSRGGKLVLGDVYSDTVGKDFTIMTERRVNMLNDGDCSGGRTIKGFEPRTSYIPDDLPIVHFATLKPKWVPDIDTLIKQQNNMPSGAVVPEVPAMLYRGEDAELLMVRDDRACIYYKNQMMVVSYSDLTKRRDYKQEQVDKVAQLLSDYYAGMPERVTCENFFEEGAKYLQDAGVLRGVTK